jgi:hypothetical protein
MTSAQPLEEKVSDLTVGELHTLIRNVVMDVLEEITTEGDPDEGLTFKPEVAAYLRQAMSEKKRGTPMEEVFLEMDIDVDE